MPTVHLHWLYENIPLKDAIAALRETSSGFALCGEARLPNKQLTVFVDDTTCKKCLTKAQEQPTKAAMPPRKRA